MAAKRNALEVWFRIGVYGSLVFLAITLYRADYLFVPEIRSLPWLGLSFFLLFAGTLTLPVAWQRMLASAGIHVPLRVAAASIGLSIFGKYIPGKIWMILGRAAYVAEASGRRLSEVSAVSLNAQLVTLWVGLGAGVGALIAGRVGWEWGSPVAVVFVALGVLLFASPVQRWGAELVSRRFKRIGALPVLSTRNALAALPIYLGCWALWSAAFYSFATALCPASLHWSVALAFPLAATLGILAVVMPGGLGVREGVLAALLSLAGLELEQATTIAVSQRLWFLTGETFIFVTGLLARPSSPTD